MMDLERAGRNSGNKDSPYLSVFHHLPNLFATCTYINSDVVSDQLLNQEEKFMAKVNNAFVPDGFEEKSSETNSSHVKFNLLDSGMH